MKSVDRGKSASTGFWRADENRRQDLAIDTAQEEEAAEEAAARDKHTMDSTA